jgi:AraC family transcriptional regulator
MVKIIQTGVPTWVDLDKPSAIGIEELTITPSTQLRPVAETIAVIGAPVCMHTVGDKSSPNAVIARWRHSGGDFDISASDIVSVTMNLQDGGVTARHKLGKAASRAHVGTVGGVTVVPARQRTRISVQGQADVLQIYLRESFLEAAVDGQFACFALFNSHDSKLQAAAMQIFVAATRGDPDDSLLLESSVHRIAARLLDHGNHRPPGPTRGGLARAAHRRVDDMITAALDDTTTPSPTLDQLASAACLSVNHFIRAFHQQTGVTPHRHIVLRRLERGIAMLKKPGKSVAEVADGTGFATPAHFDATFRQTMGVTPGAFRAALLG